MSQIDSRVGQPHTSFVLITSMHPCRFVDSGQIAWWNPCLICMFFLAYSPTFHWCWRYLIFVWLNHVRAQCTVTIVSFYMFLSINHHSKLTCEFTCWSNVCFTLDCFPCYFHGSWWSQGHMQRLGPVAIPHSGHSATSGKPHQTMLRRWFYNCSYSEQPLDFLRQNWVPEFANLRFSHFFLCIMPRGYKTWPTKSIHFGPRKCERSDPHWNDR